MSEVIAVVILAGAVGYLVLDYFVLTPRREKKIAERIVKKLQEEGWLREPPRR